MSPPGPKNRSATPTAEAPQIGGYTVLRLIGHGGAGRVFAARDEALGRTVAIKVLHPQVASDPRNVERFLREARAMATISSPHVAAIHQVGQHRKVPFIVMEYLEGENLEQRLQRDRRLPVEEALVYVRDCALALKAADAAGLVHRDVKPANIVVLEGRAKLTDFGTARPVDGSADMTAEGQIPGTAPFMAPERVTGSGDDRRADIYSLGATLYCLISGEPPFLRATPVEVIAAHLREEPQPLEQKVPGVSTLVGGVVRRMMAKDPAARFQTYDELLRALEGLLRGGPQAFGAEGAFEEQTEAYAEWANTLPPSSGHGEPELNDPFAPPPPSFMGPPGTGAMVGEPTGVMGTLKQMSIVDICHMLEMGKKDAEIELTAIEGISGELCFEAGQVVYCVWGDAVAEEAFYRVARRKEGFFRIHYGRRTTKKNIDVPTAFLMLEAMRRLDEDERGGPAEGPAEPERHAPVVDDDFAATTDRATVKHPDATLPMGTPAFSFESEGAPIVEPSAESPLDEPTLPVPVEPSPSGDFSEPLPAAMRPAMTPRATTVRASRPSTVGTSSSSAWLRNDTLLISPNERSDDRSVVSSSLGGAPSVERPTTGSPSRPSRSLAPQLASVNAQLSDVTVRALEGSSALAPLAAQVRARPWLPLAVLCLGCFAIAFIIVALLALAPAGESSLARMDGKDAAALLAQIESVPPLERTAKQELARAQALADLGRTEDALEAYRAAAKLGLVEERGLALALSQLGEPNPVAAMDLLVEYPREEATEALLERVKADSWDVRHNALLVLDERGLKGRVDLEALAVQDLLTGPTCKQRRLGLMALKEHGKSQRAREAVQKAAALKDGDNACMRSDLDAMLPR